MDRARKRCKKLPRKRPDVDRRLTTADMLDMHYDEHEHPDILSLFPTQMEVIRFFRTYPELDPSSSGNVFWDWYEHLNETMPSATHKHMRLLFYDAAHMLFPERWRGVSTRQMPNPYAAIVVAFTKHDDYIKWFTVRMLTEHRGKDIWFMDY